MFCEEVRCINSVPGKSFIRVRVLTCRGIRLRSRQAVPEHRFVMHSVHKHHLVGSRSRAVSVIVASWCRLLDLPVMSEDSYLIVHSPELPVSGTQPSPAKPRLRVIGSHVGVLTLVYLEG